MKLLENTPLKTLTSSRLARVNLNITFFSNVKSVPLLMILALVLCSCIASPALAGTKYMSGSPNLSVSIVGNNEFTAGATIPLQIKVQNSGLNKLKFVESSIIDRDDSPNTAKLVNVTLLSGSSPAIIRTDSQMIGDIKGSDSTLVTYNVYIPDDAVSGTYNLPVTLQYTYLNSADQDGTDTISYRYWNENREFTLPLVIKSTINLDIVDAKSDNIYAGGSGNITLTLKNIGRDTGKKAIAFLNRTIDSPIVPVSNGVYIGDFAPGSTAQATFKVSVSEDAHPQEYPVMVAVAYDNLNSETLQTPFKRVGIPVGPKVHFTVTSDAPKINPGNKNPVEVTYRNDGTVPVYSAEARISAVDPFSSSNDLSYLGDLKPGESAKARFDLTLTGDADTKVYGLDSEVKYRDSNDDSHVSDTVKVPINVVKPEGLAAIVSNPIVIAIIIVIILGGLYTLREKQRKQQNR